MHLEHRRSGQPLFHQGDPSNTLYLIKSGWVRLLAEGGTVLASQGVGSLVGESDLFLDRPRSFGASAASDVELWALSREDLIGMISDDPHVGLKLSLAFGERLALLDRYLVEQRLKPLSFFARLDDESLAGIARRLIPMEKENGAFVVERGQPPQGLFIVEAGQLHLHSSEEGGDFSELGAGESFGELAVVTGKPHARSVQAAGDAILWVLSAADFEEVAAQRPKIRLALSQSIREPLLPEDQTRAVDRLGTMPLFEELSEEVLWAVADRLLLLHVPAGETVFSQGARGDALYIVDDGQVEVISDDRTVGRTVLGRLGTDDYFGEMELMTGKPRSNGVRAVAHTNLWVLYRSDFDDLINRYSSISLALSKTLTQRLATLDKRFTESHLRGLKLLAGLSPSQLDDVSRRLKPARSRQGEAVVREGEPGHEMFFIESGRVRVLRQTDTGIAALAELGAGDLFGEMALLTGSPRSATVTAISDVNLWLLSQADFEALVTAYPNLALALSRLLSERLHSTDTRLLQQTASTRTTAHTPKPRAARTPQPAPPARTPRPTAYAAPRSATPRTAPRAAAATARPAPGPSVVDEMFGAFDGLIAWFSGLSAWGKVRLLVIIAALAWLLFIAAPSLVISTLAADNVTNLHGAIAFVQTSTPDPFDNPAAAQAETLDPAVEMLAAPAASQAESLEGAGAGAGPAVEALGMTAMSAPGQAEPASAARQAEPGQGQAEAAAGAEEMPQAALDAQPQVAPTETPYIIVVTNTPLPPTDTPLPPTETPVPPTNTPRPVADTLPAATARPQPTPTAAERPQPERRLDERLSALNVGVQPTGVRAGQSYWRLVEARWADEAQAAGAHSIFIDVLDENGSKLVGQPVEIRWEGGSLTVNTEAKPANEFSANFPMYNTLGSYSVRVSGLPSDVVVGLGLGTPQSPNFKVHTCFYLTFQRVMR
ncbi:MAG: cyclic nucleotide-binding domain-containing protein [Anaerolineae bacterium]|nr:cyclic nucleotide-binding domain-containing protein [Anaerolineae bacterium]